MSKLITTSEGLVMMSGFGILAAVILTGFVALHIIEVRKIGG